MWSETKLHSHNDGTGTITFETSQNAEPILQDARARHNEGMHGSGDVKHAARLPMVAIDRYCHAHNITFQEFSNNKTHIRAMLNDPELKGFRIWPGRV